jgi:NodT family efflux transporter outer membrane factor (OMF) lipoprotein
VSVFSASRVAVEERKVNMFNCLPFRRYEKGAHWRKSLAQISVAMVLAYMTAGCAAGPNFHRPDPPKSADYTPQPLPQQMASSPGIAGGDAQHFTAGDISWRWWTLFESPQLNALIEQAFKNNPTILNAQSALRQAQEMVSAQRGFFYPSVSADYNFERQKLAGNLSGSSAPGVQGNGTDIAPVQNLTSTPHNEPLYYNFQTAQLTVGYTPDVFGSNRRQVESLQAQAEAQRFGLEAAYMTLASNIVAAAIQEAALRMQLEAVHAIVDENRKSLDILRRQFAVGYVMRADVAAQEAQLAQAQALLPPLDKQLEQTRDLIRALAGYLPNQGVAATFNFEDLHLPRELPLTLPWKLIDQRPDVRAAESLLHSANAQVGVAIAARLPQFSITGAVGGTATEFGQMFASGGPFWNLIAGATLPLFDGGTLRHRQRAAEQALIQAATQYRSTVIAAYQNVADTLHAIYSDADGLEAAVQYEHATKIQLDIAQRQLTTGMIGELFLLQAQESYQQALINRVQAQELRFGDSAALFMALGGGWWNRPARQ